MGSKGKEHEEMENKITVVIIGVKDMERAVKFYGSVLKLPLKFKTDSYSEFETKGAVLALEKRDKIATATGPSFTLQSKNAEKDFKSLEKKGVKFWKPLKKEPYGLVFMPQDSELNIFEVVQYVKDKKSSGA